MRTRRSAERLGEEQRMEEEKKEREAFAAAPLVVKDENGEDEEEAVDEFVENEDEAEHMLRVFQALLEEDGAEVDLRSE